MKQRILTQSSQSTGYSWNVIVFGVMAFAVLLWQRFASAQTASGYNPFLGQRQFANMVGNNAVYSMQFPGLTPWVTAAAVAYHTNNPALAFVTSLPFWGTAVVNAQALPTIIDFNKTLPLNLGLILEGGAANDSTGVSVARAGDVNGDGKNDFLIGAHYSSPSGRSQAGTAYLIYGAANLPAMINLGNLGTAGVTLEGAVANDRAGYSVASAGDINGDGKDDFLVGAYYASPIGRTYVGVAYLIYGAANLPAIINLGSLGSAGVTCKVERRMTMRVGRSLMPEMSMAMVKMIFSSGLITQTRVDLATRGQRISSMVQRICQR